MNLDNIKKIIFFIILTGIIFYVFYTIAGGDEASDDIAVTSETYTGEVNILELESTLQNLFVGIDIDEFITSFEAENLGVGTAYFISTDGNVGRSNPFNTDSSIPLTVFSSDDDGGLEESEDFDISDLLDLEGGDEGDIEQSEEEVESPPSAEIRIQRGIQ